MNGDERMTEQKYKEEYTKILKAMDKAKEEGQDLKQLRAKLKALKLYYDTRVLNSKEMDKLS
ncbi:hypothetical protein [Clostridium botulinum]|uniref:hypothetical protein n=1 Tax=Clostridium botulinum TaxID=1491 RepID=UPI00138F3D27|nr:hypothetical protein [Clostridium botulinum]